MPENKTMRLNKVLKELNISLDRAVEHLHGKGYEVEERPTTKISQEEYQVLLNEFQTDKSKKVASREIGKEKKKEKEAIRSAQGKKSKNDEEVPKEEKLEVVKAKAEKIDFKTVGKIDLEIKQEKKPEKPIEEPVVEIPEQITLQEDDVKVIAETEKAEETPNIAIPKETILQEEKVKPAKAAPIVEVKKENIVTNKITIKKPKVIADKEIEKNLIETVEKPKAKIATKQAEEIKTTTTASTENPEVIKGEIVKGEATIETQYKKLSGLTITGQKIDLNQFKKPEKKKTSNQASEDAKKKKRKRIAVNPPNKTPRDNRSGDSRVGRNQRKATPQKAKVEEPTQAEIQKQIRETLEKLHGKSKKGKGAKYRKEKRDQHRQQTQTDIDQQEAESKILKVTEFVTVSEIAILMDIPPTNIISTCMSLGMMVTMNQRLDAETLAIVVEEFGYQIEFIKTDIEESIEEIIDQEEDLESRAPVVTVMGHVDHGKTSLLDYIRQENVIAGESGGITQHIGAYGVELKNKQRITFLDTPGHEAFTAMRARGGQVADIVIIVIASDDEVMPQTKEAISHAQAASVPIIFAINKVDKPTANPERIKEQLASMNLLVEEWGGKIQSHDISAKTGLGVDELLEKVLLEAEIQELKANPNRAAIGTVVESFLDKGRGYIATVLVQHGTLKIGDYMLAGKQSGKIKAMFDERGKRMKEADPSTPVSILGLDGALQSGDKFQILEDEKEAKNIAAKRSQLQREQSVRTQRHITLDEIGRRIALGDFKGLNIILKGDVDGSVEALTNSFQKLSSEEIQVNIIHKAVGAITESDVLLASASDAIVIGFNVRPSANAKSIADKEQIDIRTYSIIYDAIGDLKDAMEGMLSPELKEEITGTVEVREIYKISKIGNIAGCMVVKGKILRNSKVRVIRDHVVIHSGELSSLKRFKDDVKEVTKGYDCGIQLKNFNNIQESDELEAYHEIEVRKTLS
jgi:translation initiation factor IF-2